MVNLTSKFPTRLKLLGLCFPTIIGLCLIAAKPASACLPIPGSRPAPLEERVSSTPYVFEGTIAQVNRDILTIRVNRYFKGEGPELLRLSGFNQHSCQDIIGEAGGRYLFFAEEGEKEAWNAVYDGAFGSVRPWSEEIEAELRELGAIARPNPPQNLPRSVANAVKRAAARETRLSPTRIEILQAESRTWSDNCLGLPFPDRGCLQILVEGWQVTVRAGNRQLTYRSDDRGNIVYLDNTNDSTSLPQSVADAVKRETAQTFGISPDRLQIVNARSQTWPNGCLGITIRDRACTQALVEGWLVELRAGNQRFLYRTDESGNTIYLDNGVDVLPANVREAVLTAAANKTQLPRNQLRMTAAFPQVWDGCLGIREDPQQICTKIAIFGWQVAIEGRDHSLLVYHTNQNGSDVRLNANASRLNLENTSELPAGVKTAILEAAARQTGLPAARLRITQAQRRTWDGCLGIARDRQNCPEIAILGWQVTVEGGENRLVYHTDGNGSDVRLNLRVSRLVSGDLGKLPAGVENAVLEAAARQTGLPRARLHITQAQRRTWDGCLGIYRDRRACPEIGILGWRVAVEGDDNQLVYHTNGDGSDVRLNLAQSRLENDGEIIPVRLPIDETQNSLPKGAIFQAMSMGGIAGQTSRITLWSDGKVTIQSGPMPLIPTQTRWVSRQQVRYFQQILREQRFARYDGLNFPPPPGSADIVGMTLIGQRGTTHVADYDREKLPQPLQVVLASWSELLDSLQEQPIIEQRYRRDRIIHLNSPMD